MPIFGRGCLARKTMKIAPRTPREKQNQRMTCPSFCSLAIPNSVDAENQLEAIRFMTSGNTVRLDIAGPNPTPNESKHIESQYSEYLAAQAERERQREQELQEERAEAARRLNSKREKENLAPRRR
jgi:hypothetical protein